MSYTETHVGKLRKIDTGTNLEQWYESKCKESGINEIKSYNDTWEDEFRDKFSEKYFITNDEIWEVFDHTESNDEFMYTMIPQPDGTIVFAMLFDNGGTCLSEMIEEGLSKLNKSNQ